MARWDVVCRPKDQGGLGIHDLLVKNSALLEKWLFKILSEEGTWKTILRRKYFGSKTLSQVVWKPGDSHFWAGLMATKKFFFRFGKFAIRDGSEIRFWEDKWLGNAPLKDQYPSLYNVVRRKSDTLVEVMRSSPPVMTFRRDLIGHRLEAWNALLGRLAMIQLSTGTDEFRWTLTDNGRFSVDSKIGRASCRERV